MMRLLRRLADAQISARAHGACQWEYSIEVDYLLRESVSITEIREALQEGLCERRVEILDHSEASRKFQSHNDSLALPPNSVIAITQSGLLRLKYLVNQQDKANGMKVPDWNRSSGELAFENQLIKRFSRPALLQSVILDVFQEEGWPPYIDDPIPPIEGQSSCERLKSAKDGLNRRHLCPGLLRFCIREGARIGWESCRSPKF